MKKINVFVKDKNTIILNEDAKKGDYIDLTELVAVDTEAIEASIAQAKDKVYNEKLDELKKSIEANAMLDKEKALAELSLKIKDLEALLTKTREIDEEKLKAKEKEKEDALRLKESEIEKKYLDKINDLNNKLEKYDSDKNALITSINAKNIEELNNLKNKYNDELQQEAKKLTDSYNEYNLLKAKYDLDIKNKELELNNKFQNQINDLKNQNELQKLNEKATLEKLNLEHVKAIEETKHQYDDKIRNLNDTVLGLQRQRASLGSKMIGEDLEVWATNEYLSFAQTGGLSNCVWTKDNKVVRYADEVKGSKGDFILHCYANDNHLEEELLTSILFEMKNESPDTKSKQHNSDFYDKLDENRNKKHCKYAVLVSDLDRGSNDLPMSRVLDYPDMYVVRPEYMMTFINIITSVTKKFVDLVLQKSHEELNLKTKKEILEEFELIKESYLNNQLDSLSKDIDEIEKQTNNIISSANKINLTIEHIRLQYIQKIERKLEIYTPKLNKVLKRIEE